MNKRRIIYLLILISFMLSVKQNGSAQEAVRARDIDIPFKGTPGHFNAITDVKGVEVGFTTIISGEGNLKVGQGPV